MAEYEPLSVRPEKVVEWLNRKWEGDKKCPLCRQNKWSIGENTASLRPYYHRHTVLGGGPVFPLVVITCGECGYTLLLNAIIMGLVPKEVPQETTSPAEESSE